MIDLGVYGENGFTTQKRDTIPSISPELNHSTIGALARTINDYEFGELILQQILTSVSLSAETHVLIAVFMQCYTLATLRMRMIGMSKLALRQRETRPRH